MASKTLKSVKQQNKELGKAVKNQKKEELQAKQDLAQAKVEAGLFGSKEQRQAVKQAKLKYEQEKMETKQGKALQKQGKEMKSIVDSDSRMMGVFHSDKKLSAPVKQSVQQHSQSVSSFVANNGGDATKSLKITDAAKSVADTAKKGASARLLPKISDSVEKAVETSMGLGE